MSCLLFGERGHGKTSVAVAAGIGAAVAGEKVLYLDRENGPELVRHRIEAALDALGLDQWPDGLVVRCYPSIGNDWQPDDFGEAIAGLGFTAVVFDSLREFEHALSLRENLTDDISRLVGQPVTPLVRRRVAVVVLDNVGHENTDRPKGSGSKLDAIAQAFKVVTTEQFSPVLTGRISITCKRSRFGDIGREWTMRIGGGVFELPAARGEAPDARVARERGEDRERFRLAAVAALGECSPLGRDRLIAATRERGIEGSNAALRGWLAELSADPASGLASTDGGYVLDPPGRAGDGQGAANPLGGPGRAEGIPPEGGCPAGHPWPRSAGSPTNGQALDGGRGDG